MRKLALLLLTFFSIQALCRAQSDELNQIQRSLPQVTDSINYVDALNRLAILFYEKSLDSTFKYTVKARAIADRLDYPKGKADALNNLGICFDLKGNLQLALRYYDEAYVAYTKLKDAPNRIQALMNIAMVYKAMEKDEKAIHRFDSALDLGKKLNKDSIMSLVIYNYILQYPKKFSRSIKNNLIAKAKKIASKYKDERTLLAIAQLTADELINQGKRKEGFALLSRTIAAAINKKLFYVSMDMIIDMGDQLLATNQQQAITHYEQALAIAQKNNYLIYSKLINRKLFDIYLQLKDNAKAVAYGQQLLQVTDQEEQLESNSGIDYLDYALKEQQIKSLQSRSNYQIALLALSVLAFVLAIAAVIAVRQTLRRTKHMNELVTKQNVSMKKTLHALEQSQADNTRMMKIVAHDLRNPIGGISSLASMMIFEDTRNTKDIEMLTLIKTSADNSLELIGDLLEVQLSNEGLKKEPVDIAEILHYCVSLLQNQAEAKNQKLALESKEFILPANREKLWRVISNLIANAIKFSPSGSTIGITMETLPTNLLIKVSDNGIGIPQDMHTKIFDMFTEAKRLGTDGEKTYGLGLSITKQIVEAHGGKIWVESIPNQGSTFFVSLPIQG